MRCHLSQYEQFFQVATLVMRPLGRIFLYTRPYDGRYPHNVMSHIRISAIVWAPNPLLCLLP